MPEENQVTKGNDPVPEQETPIAETPPVDGVPEGQQTKVETPATPDSTKDADGAVSSKDEEQLKEDRAYFQTEAQRVKDELAQIRDQYADQEPQVQTPTPQAQTQVQPQPEGARAPRPSITDAELRGMTDDEVRERVNESPELQRDLMMYQMEQRFGQMLDERDRKRDAQVRFRDEHERTDKTLRAFCDKNEIPQKLLNEKMEHYKSLGIKASPAAIGSLIMDSLTASMTQDNIQQRATEAAAKAAQAAKTQALTTQPAGGGPQDTGKEKSPAEVIHDKYKRASGAKVIDDMLG